MCIEIERKRERGDGRGPVTVRVWPRIRIKGEGTGYHAFYFLAFVRIPYQYIILFVADWASSKIKRLSLFYSSVTKINR